MASDLKRVSGLWLKDGRSGNVAPSDSDAAQRPRQSSSGNQQRRAPETSAAAPARSAPPPPAEDGIPF